jgi:hypothetical protein
MVVAGNSTTKKATCEVGPVVGVESDTVDLDTAPTSSTTGYPQDTLVSVDGTYYRQTGSDPSSPDWREVALLNADGELVGPIIVRTGTAAELDAITLSDGEIAYTTDTEQPRFGDGSTAGGRKHLIQNTNGSIQADSGGNARGTNAVDLQKDRSNDTEVASGASSTVGGGKNNTASGPNSTVSGGFQTIADKYGQNAYSAGRFGSNGDAQVSLLIARNQTTDTTTTELFLDGSAAKATIPTDTAWEFDVHIVAAEQGMANVKKFHRTGLIVNDGGSTSISTVDTIGTDREIGAPGAWAVTLSADDTDDALKIEVDGEAATNIRWVVKISLTENSYPA